MAAEYLETAKTSERGTGTLARANVSQLQKFCPCEGKLWWQDRIMAHKNSFIVPVNYIEPILQYTKQNDLFQLTKCQKNRYDKKSLQMLIDIMDVLLPFKQSRMWKNWQSKQENFLQTTIITALKFERINWGS